MCFNPSGKQVATGSLDNNVMVWHAKQQVSRALLVQAGQAGLCVWGCSDVPLSFVALCACMGLSLSKDGVWAMGRQWCVMPGELEARSGGRCIASSQLASVRSNVPSALLGTLMPC